MEPRWTRIYVKDGIRFDVKADLDAFAHAWSVALKGPHLIEIVNSEGHQRFVNPRQIMVAETLESALARGVPPPADEVDLHDLPAFGTQFRFAWRTLRDWHRGRS